MDAEGCFISVFGLIREDLSVHLLRSFSRDDRGVFGMCPAYTVSCFAWSGVTPAGGVVLSNLRFQSCRLSAGRTKTARRFRRWAQIRSLDNVPVDTLQYCCH
jgi:hypothetical protein